MVDSRLPPHRRRGPSYWHGGPDGIKAGQFIIPAMELVSKPVWYPLGQDYPADPTLVYVTVDLDVARFHAGTLTAMGGSGSVYLVEPSDTLAIDPDFASCCFTCPRARVVQVFERGVKLTRRIDLHVARMTTWAEGGLMYDRAGFLLPSPQMLAHGIVQEDLQVLGFLPDPFEHGLFLARLTDQRIALDPRDIRRDL